jgi:hypothetical protein
LSGSEVVDFPFLPELSNFGSPPAEPVVYLFIIISTVFMLENNGVNDSKRFTPFIGS